MVFLITDSFETLFRLETCFGDVCKQCIPSSEANSADPVQTPQNVASELGLHYFLTGTTMQITINGKHPLETPKTRNGLIQMIKMDKSTGQKTVLEILHSAT